MDKVTREDILDLIRQSLGEMKDSLNLLMSGEMPAENQKEIAEAVKKVYEETEKGIPKAARSLIDSLMGGSWSKDNVWSLVSRTIGTIWEVLMIGQIQLVIDAHYPEHILEIGVSPDLPGLDVDVKSTSKKDGEGTSASSKGNTVIDLGRMRILGLNYDVLYIRYEADSIKRLEFIGREDFADPYCYNLMRGATEAMLEGGELGDEEKIFLCLLASHLILKLNPKKDYDDPRAILDWIINSIIRDDIAHSARRGKDGLSQTRMKATIKWAKKALKEFAQSEADKSILKKLRLKQGTNLEETQAEFRKIQSIGGWLDILYTAYVNHLDGLERPPPKGSSKKEKLLWLEPIIQLSIVGATNIPLSQAEHMISHFTSEEEPKFKAATKSYELVLNFAQKDEEE